MVDFETAEAMGISRQAFDEVLDIIGRQPTIDELSTLLAMWESNGKQQSLYGWLRGQHHVVERNEYLYSGSADHKAIREPRVKECLEIAREITCKDSFSSFSSLASLTSLTSWTRSTGLLLYMVGNVSGEFVDSEYARRCLHLVDEPMAAGGHEEDCQYIEMILDALKDGEMLLASAPVGQGGLFCSLLRFLAPTQTIKQSRNQAIGFDILVPREVRLDAFLFGEEKGRYVLALEEKQDDAFLLKMDDARLNCCFLGRTTKNRVVVDGYDFGPTTNYSSAN
jgi:phosphoribosylformylglycinamidine (FGAM) synthase-like enzyme